MQVVEEISVPGTYVEETLVDGVVKAVEGEGVLVSLGAAGEGMVPLAELTRAGAKAEVGQSMSLFVDKKDTATGRWVLSKEKADRLALWDRVVAQAEAHATVEGTVVGVIEGGFSIDIGVKAFCPGSQIDLFGGRDPDRFLEQVLQFRIIRFDRKRNNIVVSRRVLLEEVRQKTLEKVRVGAVLEGRVKSLADYGAFVDLGGIHGLVHVSDMSWGRVGHPSEIVDVGDSVRVKVLKFDPESQKISLGIRQLQEDPWADAATRYAVGNPVKGTVVSITDYGMFLELEPGVEGLLHTAGGVLGAAAARDLVRRSSIGDLVEAVVLETDIAKKRISLGIKPQASTAS